MANCHGNLMNELLKTEMAAAETYERAMAKVHQEPVATGLQIIYEQHRAAVETLCREIRQMGCEPEHDCESWEALRTIDRTPEICGNTEAIQALKADEETQLHSYEEALNDQLLPVISQTLIRTKLLPQARKHISVLDHLMSPN